MSAVLSPLVPASPTSRPLAAALLTALLTVLVPVGASVASAGGGTGDGGLGKRLEAACARVPVIARRVDAVIARLDGPAATRGSLAWLQDELAAQIAANHPRIASDIQHRIDVLTQRLATLHLRQSKLAEIAAICASKGLAA